LELTEVLLQAFKITTNFTVEKAVEKPKGKWPSSLGHTMYFNMDSFYNNLKQDIIDNLNEILNNDESAETNFSL